MLMEFAEYSDGSSAIQVDPSNCGNFRKEVFEVKFNLPKKKWNHMQKVASLFEAPY